MLMDHSRIICYFNNAGIFIEDHFHVLVLKYRSLASLWPKK